MQDGKPGVPAQNTPQQPVDNGPKNYDYFGAKLKGFTDEHLFKGMKPGDDVIIR